MVSPADRRQQIVATLVKYGENTVEELARELDVSSMTIYRDVAELEAASLVTRRRGMIRAADSSLVESAAAIRISSNEEVKDTLAAGVVQYLRPGLSVCLDDSTTNLSLLTHLENMQPITVITNAEFIAKEVRAQRDTELILTGGTYETWADAYSGLITESTIASVRADVCVMSATAVDLHHHYHPSQSISRVKRAMLASSRFSILAIDASKLERSALFKVGDLKEFDVIVADSRLPDDYIAQLQENGHHVDLA
ncbi:DeoR/GlpR family transcriptional regulator of sugar metabolism [Trueperella bonasi]|uniref:DeoR/GlpR family transcriptional regulator of sugar metabolism n=1 Tax=Trueperella bonasi TaxID=312286 RepID=A0ABT9NIQ0_9ACTO|nr:DeoR/GlpR family DNA-binding transcription regulator [Trueperella bonasi]MDP9807090.1 DeoR/GlpR family transcriptional regulator of sugar metabolism [Trueperella bonasi]